jgi:hypothetical protein
MMRRLQIASLCSAATFCLATVAQAASLNVTQGDVLLSRGAGYQTVKGSVDLLAGDTVLGKPGSAAQLAFDRGCTVPLEVGTVFRVGKTSPCTLHSAGAGASGATETPSDVTEGQNTPPDVTEGQKPKIWPYVLGGVVIGGGVAALVATGGSDHHGGSP